jgi:ankyrin repeat protein
VSSIASAGSYERGLTTQISIASGFTATVTIRDKPQDAEKDSPALESQTERLEGPGARPGEEKPPTERIDEETRETQDLLATSSHTTGSGDMTESVTVRASAVPAKAPESPSIVEAEPTTTQEPKPKDPKAILAAIRAHKRSVMVMPLSIDDLELVQLGYDRMPPFSKACQANDLRGFSRLDYDVKERSWNGQTPLSIAIEAGWIDLAKRLIHLFDADVNAASYDGKTPLFYAAALNSRDTLKEAMSTLIKAGANIDHRSRLGQTPLSWAAANGHWEAISSLLSDGADIEAKSNNGQSPLSWAAMYGQDVAVRLLVTKGADIETTSNNSYTPLLWSMEKGHESTTKLLLHLGAKLDNEKRLGTSSIFRALEAGFRGTIVSLLAKHPEMIEERNQIMQTPLGWAAEHGDDWSVELLVSSGANLEAKSNNGQTPLSRAATYAPWSTVHILLQKGADIESESYNGQTPLSWAAMYGRVDLVERLLAQGANVNTRSRNGQAPLDWAMEKGQDLVGGLLRVAKLAAAASKA